MPSPSPRYALFSKGTYICLRQSLIIMFPVCPIWSHDSHFENVEFKPCLWSYNRDSIWKFVWESREGWNSGCDLHLEFLLDRKVKYETWYCSLWQWGGVVVVEPNFKGIEPLKLVTWVVYLGLGVKYEFVTWYLMQNLEYLVLTCTWHFEIQNY